MPTYEYLCKTSGKRFEKFQSIRDAPLGTCPDCGGPAQRLVSAGAAVISKGRGPGAAERGYGSPHQVHCGRRAPCCGRDVPCDRPPCED